jgi:hypothetical protein
MARTWIGRTTSKAVAGGAAVLLASTLVVPTTVGAAPAREAAPTSAAAPAGNPAPDPVALPVRPKSDRYARQIFERLRAGLAPATDDEIVGLGEELDASGNPPAKVRALLLAEPWLGARIGDTYQAWLGRPADPSGLAFWRGRVQRGTTLEQLELAFALSAESWRKGGGTNAGYVDVVYTAIFGAPADPQGKAFWTGRLDGGTTRDAFVRGLLRSNQRATRIVRAAFLEMLGRSADPGGLASRVDQYRTARIGELDLNAALLGSTEARNQGCDPSDPRLCLLPFPNDRFTVEDPTTATGRRVSFKPEWMPRNVVGTPVNPQEWNRNDGFSVGQAALVKVPGIDLDETDAVPLDDLGAYDDADAPIVVIDADTGERHPVFVELDANIPEADRAADQLLSIRPSVNWEAGHRYIVGLRGLKRADGSTIAAPPTFQRVLDDDIDGLVGDAYDRAVASTFLVAALADAGFSGPDLYLAWDFTVASTTNTTGRMLSMRDDALEYLDGAAPEFAITSIQEAPDTGVLRRIEGTFEVPMYLTGRGEPGDRFAYGSDGAPVRTGTYTARFGCQLPVVDGTATARPVVYGHGLFGSYTEVFSSPQRAMVREHDMAYCATDWIGMSSPDVANAAVILGDLSSFGSLPDRTQQGIVNFIVLGRLMTLPDGFASNAAFQHDGGAARIDGSALQYDGNSQGGILGGAYLAASPDTTAGVLGVVGMNYSTLLERSVDFDPFAALMKPNYPSAPDRVLGLQLIQMLWDRGEVNGYAAHLGGDPLPGSSASRVLLHTALGDHQVATFTAEILARTAGMAIHRPIYLEGRTTDVEPGWALPTLAYPSTGSALVVWDSGSPLAPLTNVPPRAGRDPHSDPRADPEAQQQKSDFLKADGSITNVCGSDPCTAGG